MNYKYPATVLRPLRVQLHNTSLEHVPYRPWKEVIGILDIFLLEPVELFDLFKGAIRKIMAWTEKFDVVLFVIYGHA